MAIDQVRAAQFIANLQKPAAAVSLTESVTPFEDLLRQAVQSTMETDSATKTDAFSLVTGGIDAPHNVTINAAKADLAVQMLVAVRNKALDAYNEIMRITL